MLAACSSNSSLVSSFSQRKYTKGYFNDAIGEKPAVTGIKTNKAEEKNAIQISKQIPSLEGLRGGYYIPTRQASKKLSNVLSIEPQKPVQKISDLSVPYKTIPAVNDSTKTRDNTSPRKLTGFQNFLIMHWATTYVIILLILGLLTKLTTGLAYTIINIAFFTLLTPWLLAFAFLMFYLIYCLMTKQQGW
jgi:hypothetical protein